MKNIDTLAADNIRILSASMVEKAKSGHPGGAMGGADFIHILYSDFLKFDPKNPEWKFRDRFFLDPGHMSPMLYAQLALCGYFSMDDLANFRQWGSITPGHPEVDVKRGIENTSGPLGLGHAFGIGAAIAERFLAGKFGEWTAHKTYVYISDGGIQEEISQGGGRIAGHLGLSNLIMFYDSNDIQLSTEVKEVTSENTAAKYESWGWKVVTINGNDANQIRKALTNAQAETDKPTLIIGKTIMGKGAIDAEGNSFENKTSTHGQPLSAAGASFEKTIEKLGGNPENPFVIFDEVKQLYAEKLTKKQAFAERQYNIEKKWASENNELAQKLEDFFNKKISHLNWKSITQKDNDATRNASANVLKYLANNLENIIVASADLSDSDKTNSFLSETRAFAKNDFSGTFIQAGVSELTMAAIANGLALHGGIIPVCATFFVFSDYMKPALRMSALMEKQVIYLWTHDSFRVGEDGPTHQPVEHEAQIRLMEQLKNHSGKASVLALRPAGSAETTVAWKMAIENKNRPTALILSRQAMEEVELQTDETYYKRSLNAEKGAYTVWQSNTDKPIDLILLANGSEVATLFGAAKLITAKKDINIRLVSIISQGKFRATEKAYQEELIPSGVPVFALTAGLPATFASIKANKLEIMGLEYFGHSAPANVLDEKFGFKPESVSEMIEKFIGK